MLASCWLAKGSGCSRAAMQVISSLPMFQPRKSRPHFSGTVRGKGKEIVDAILESKPEYYRTMIS